MDLITSPRLPKVFMKYYMLNFKGRIPVARGWIFGNFGTFFFSFCILTIASILICLLFCCFQLVLELSVPCCLILCMMGHGGREGENSFNILV